MKSWIVRALMLALVAVLATGSLVAQPTQPTTQHRSEADLVLPDLGSVDFVGVSGDKLLFGGLFICVLGLLFGVMMYAQLKSLPVHRSMREISELIYETCKTY